MEGYISLRQKARIQNSLIILLQGLIGRRTVVELRNETSVTGRIESVDDCLNTCLTDAIFKTLNGRETNFSQFYIQGKNIRFVHIPDDVDIMDTIKQQLGMVQAKHQRGRRESKQVQKEIKKRKYQQTLMKKTMQLKEKLLKMEAKRRERVQETSNQRPRGQETSNQRPRGQETSNQRPRGQETSNQRPRGQEY